MGAGDPFPDGPEDADGQGLHVTRGDVDEEVADVSVGDGFEVFGDGLEVGTGDEGGVGFEDGEGGLDEGVEVDGELLGRILVVGLGGGFGVVCCAGLRQWTMWVEGGEEEELIYVLALRVIVAWGRRRRFGLLTVA